MYLLLHSSSLSIQFIIEICIYLTRRLRRITISMFLRQLSLIPIETLVFFRIHYLLAIDRSSRSHTHIHVHRHTLVRTHSSTAVHISCDQSKKFCFLFVHRFLRIALFSIFSICHTLTPKSSLFFYLLPPFKRPQTIYYLHSNDRSTHSKSIIIELYFISNTFYIYIKRFYYEFLLGFTARQFNFACERFYISVLQIGYILSIILCMVSCGISPGRE